MEQNKMTPPMLKVILNNPLSIVPGHTIKKDDPAETPVGVIFKGGGLSGKKTQEDISYDITAAYNNTYGAKINPEAVPHMLNALIDHDDPTCNIGVAFDGLVETMRDRISSETGWIKWLEKQSKIVKEAIAKASI